MFVVKRLKSLDKGALKAVFDVQMQSPNWEIHGCKLFEKEGRQWVSPPTMPYTDKNGQKAYSDVIKMSKEDRDVFSRLCIEAIKIYQKNPPSQDIQEEISF